MSMTCMNILGVYSMISTIVIIFLAIFLARCGSEVNVVDGDSESVTKTDIGTNGEDGEATCICPGWNSWFVLEFCVVGTFILLRVFGVFKLVKCVLLYLAKKRTREEEVHTKKQEELVLQIRQKELKKLDAIRATPAGERIEYEYDITMLRSSYLKYRSVFAVS